ncbi:MAG: tRNA pseudouridine(55) synthase TruB [Thermodesulfobacteriota bacterium]
MTIDGFLVVDKPEGWTSSEVVRRIKSWFSIKRAGHVGTLDPFATGVLPVVLNEARRIVPFLKEDPKEYEAEMKLGEETTTDDLTGETLSQRSLNELTLERIQEVFKTFVGQISQIPPMFSAVKIQGVPLYRWARKGIEKERPKRRVEIFELEIQEVMLPKIRFKVSCSKGTYIRALARDIGKALECGAHLTSLRRLRSGPFYLKDAISLEDLKRISSTDSLSPRVLSPEEALSDLLEVRVNELLIKKVSHGKEVLLKDLFGCFLPDFKRGQALRMSSLVGKVVAILLSLRDREEIDQSQPEEVVFRPLRVFSRGISPIHTKNVMCEGGRS